LNLGNLFSLSKSSNTESTLNAALETYKNLYGDGSREVKYIQFTISNLLEQQYVTRSDVDYDDFFMRIKVPVKEKSNIQAMDSLRPTNIKLGRMSSSRKSTEKNRQNK